MTVSATSATDLGFIQRPEQLGDVAAALATAPWVALDSESNSMFVYTEQVCLLQVNAGGALFVVDPLALGGVAGQPCAALEPLKAGLERTDRPLYLHGGEYDVACLRRDFGFALGGVFDTQQAASLLGWPKTGYGSIVEALCGVPLGKAYATYDWATRPLDPAALAYAVDDVVYLPRIAEHLRAAVAAAGIDDEVREANGVVAAAVWNGGYDPASLWRLRDIEGLPAESLRVLARLHGWRDAAARQENLPPGRMVNNEVLLLIARHRPTTLEALKKVRLKGFVVAKHGPALLQAMAQAKDDETPKKPEQPQLTSTAQARESRLKAWRREEAERRSKVEERAIPLQLVLPARALDHLKLHGADDLDAVPQLGAARRQRYGDQLRALCAAG